MAMHVFPRVFFSHTCGASDLCHLFSAHLEDLSHRGVIDIAEK